MNPAVWPNLVKLRWKILLYKHYILIYVVDLKYSRSSYDQIKPYRKFKSFSFWKYVESRKLIVWSLQSGSQFISNYTQKVFLKKVFPFKREQNTEKKKFLKSNCRKICSNLLFNHSRRHYVNKFLRTPFFAFNFIYCFIQYSNFWRKEKESSLYLLRTFSG